MSTPTSVPILKVPLASRDVTAGVNSILATLLASSAPQRYRHRTQVTGSPTTQSPANPPSQVMSQRTFDCCRYVFLRLVLRGSSTSTVSLLAYLFFRSRQIDRLTGRLNGRPQPQLHRSLPLPPMSTQQTQPSLAPGNRSAYVSPSVPIPVYFGGFLSLALPWTLWGESIRMARRSFSWVTSADRPFGAWARQGIDAHRSDAFVVTKVFRFSRLRCVAFRGVGTSLYLHNRCNLLSSLHLTQF